jgi:hypothetical protein
MAWLSNNSFSATDKLHAVDMNNVANDIRNWGGDVNGGGFNLFNCTISGVFTDPTTTVGDLIVHGPTAGTVGSLQRLPIVVGDGLALVIDHTQTLGVKWGVAAQGMLDPTTTKGDLIVKPSGAAPTRFPIGADSHILICDSSQTTGLRWGTITGFAAPGNDKQVMVNTAGVPGASAGLVYDYSKGHLLVGGGADDGSAAVVQVTGITHTTMRVRSDMVFSPKAWPSASSYTSPDAGYGGIGYQGASIYWYWNGAAYAAVDFSRLASILSDPTTTLGDLIVRGTSAVARFPVGADTYLLVADSTQPLGLRWQPPPAIGVTSAFGRTGAVIAQAGDYTVSMVTNAVDATQSYANPAWITSIPWSKITAAPTFLIDPTTAKGDLITRTASATTRLVIGSVDGELLTVDSTSSTGMKWASPSTTFVTTISPGALSGAVVFTAGANVTLSQVNQQIAISVPNINSSTGMSDPTTSQGDLIVHGLTAGTARMPVGTTGQILTVDTTQDLGMKWAAPAAFVGVTSLSPGALVGAITLLGGSNVLISQSAQNITIGVPNVMVDPMTTKGDLVVYGTPTARLPVGTNGQVLTVDLTTTLGVKWAAATAGTAAGADKQVQVNEAGIMGASPNLLFDYNNGFLTLTSPTGPSMYMAQYLYTGAQPSAGCIWDSYVARGTSAAPTAVQAGGRLVDIRGWGYDGAANRYAAEIVMFAESTFTSGVGYGNIVFATNNGAATISERMRITAAGLVGIGTASPTEVLDVNGHLRQRYVTGMGAGYWLDNSTAVEQCFVGMNAATNTWRVYSALTGVGYNCFAVNLDPAQGGVATIAGDASNLGTNVNFAQLIIRGSPVTGNTNKNLLIGVDTTNNVGVVQFGIAGTGWNNLLLNPSGGNIGINTITPMARLSLGSASTGNISLALFDDGSGSGMYGFGIGSGDLRFCVGTSVANFSFYPTDASTTPLMRILGTGNVGIGISAPAYTLDVNGTIHTAGFNCASALFKPASGNLTLTFQDGAPSATTNLVQSPSLVKFSNNAIPLEFDANTNAGVVNQLCLATNGFVGINTAAPIAPLHVGNLGTTISSAFNIHAVAVFDDGGTGSHMGMLFKTGATAGAAAYRGFQIYKNSQDFAIVRYDSAFSAAPQFDLMITAAGTVGLGVTNPPNVKSQLHVLGVGTQNTSYTPGDATGATLYLQDLGGAGNNGGQILFGSTYGVHCGIKAAVQSGTGPGGDMLFQTAVISGAGVCQERMRITNGGLVGINTAAPTCSGTGKFHIGGANTTRFFDTVRTPGTSADACYIGELFFDQNYLYVATANNQIKRIPLTAF